MAQAKSHSLNRFHLSADADRDLDEILTYLDQLPLEPGNRIAQSLQSALLTIAKNPYLGSANSHLTLLLGEEIRSYLVYPYRIFYRASRTVPEIIAILHGARDQSSILGRRFQ